MKLKIGTPGHAVVPVLNEALQRWAGDNLKTINYVHKGMCCSTEMYSAIAADVPIPSDPSTYLNHKLLEQLNEADKVFHLFLYYILWSNIHFLTLVGCLWPSIITLR